MLTFYAQDLQTWAVFGRRLDVLLLHGQPPWVSHLLWKHGLISSAPQALNSAAKGGVAGLVAGFLQAQSVASRSWSGKCMHDAKHSTLILAWNIHSVIKIHSFPQSGRFSVLCGCERQGAWLGFRTDWFAQKKKQSCKMLNVFWSKQGLLIPGVQLAWCKSEWDAD